MPTITPTSRKPSDFGIDTGYIGLRCFIEGVEVPISKADVKASIMKAAVAKIDIPASPEVMHFKPRSLVHIFYYDSSEVPRRGRQIPAGSADIHNIEKGNPYKWNLLFAGEIHAYQYKKSSRGVKCILTCVDFTSYWSSAKIYYGSKSKSHRHFKQAIFMGAVRAFSGKRKLDSTKDLLRILRSAPTLIPQLGGLLGGIVHLLESMTGVYDRRKGNARYRGTNDFFTISEMRLHLTRMIGVCPQDTSSIKLASSTNFKKYVQQMARRTQSTASYADLIGMLLDKTYHLHTSVLCPPYMAEGYMATHWKLERLGKGLSPELKGLDKWATQAEDGLETVLRKRQQGVKGRGVNDPWHSTVDPKGITVADSGGQGTWHKSVLNAEKTVPTIPQVKAKIETMPTYASVRKDMSHAQWTALRDRLGHIKACVTKVRQQLARPVPGAVGKPDTYPEHNSQNANAAIADLAKARNKRKAIFKPRYKTVKVEHKLNDRLNSTIISPNLWMCPPPKCNIIFPSQYTSISYTRNWMSEITRMWVHGLKTNGKALWSESYFAPCSDIITHGSKAQDIAKVVKSGSSFLLRHEVFSGIIPAIQGVGDLAELKKIHTITEKVEDEEGAPNVKTWGTSLGHYMKNPALQRAANAKFMQARFLSRAMSVNGPFNPNIVCGLPGAVIDTSLSTHTPTLWQGNLDADSKPGDDITRTDTGTHYLGLVTTVHHSIGQTGSTTNVSLNFCRAHNEGLEIFDANWSKDKAVATISRRGPGKSSKVLGGPYWAEVHGWTFRFRKGRYYSIPIIGMRGVRGEAGKHITWGLHAQKAPIKTDSVAGMRAAGAGGDEGGWTPIVKSSDVLGRYDLPLGTGQTPMGEVNTNMRQTKYGNYQFKYKVKPTKHGKQKNNTIPSDHRTLEPLERDKMVAALMHQIIYELHPQGVTKEVGEAEHIGQMAHAMAEDEVYLAHGPASTRIALAKIKPRLKGGEVFHDGYKYKQASDFPWMSAKAKGAVEVTAYLVGGQGTGKPFIYNFSFEQVARPPWFSDVYLNHNIGEKFYLPLLGCDAVTDLSITTIDTSAALEGAGLVRVVKSEDTSPEGVSSPQYRLDESEIKALRSLMTGVVRDPTEALDTLAKLDKFVTELAEGKFGSKTTVIMKKGDIEYEVPAKVLGGYHVQNCINHLAYTYSEMLARNVNIQNFVEAYTNRNFACMVDIFGWGYFGDGTKIQGLPEKVKDPANPEVMMQNPGRDVVGTRSLVLAGSYFDNAEWTAEKYSADEAIEGFHSAAFGDVDEMTMLDWDTLSTESQVSAKTSPLLKADPRKPRWKPVNAYRDSMAPIGGGNPGRTNVSQDKK